MRCAVAEGVAVRAGVQCAFGCASEHDVDEAAVLAVVERLTAAGAAEINLADTAGRAQPFQVRQLVTRASAVVPTKRLSLHLHDAGGMGLANLVAGYESGVRRFDTAAGALGGCPFVKDAAGNLATENAVRVLARMGADTGIAPDILARAAQRLTALLGHTRHKRL
ncbi:hypothetical protein [Desulfobulbus sp.]|uniref:hypothetical protein n=1 Tax=Desulfobulbus sp. TaxID=895 RepID=UPI00286F57B6|nr:hypothetical protein [Desulfobulbus sp.]